MAKEITYLAIKTQEIPVDDIQKLVKSIKGKDLNLSTTPLVPVAPKTQDREVFSLILPRILKLGPKEFMALAVHLHLNYHKENFSLVFELREELLRRFKLLSGWRLKTAFILFESLLHEIVLPPIVLNKVVPLRSFYGGLQKKVMNFLERVHYHRRELEKKVHRPRIRGYRDGKGGRRGFKPLPEDLPKHWYHNRKVLESRSNWVLTKALLIVLLLTHRKVKKLKFIPVGIQILLIPGSWYSETWEEKISEIIIRNFSYKIPKLTEKT